jgi:hypothetical protein
MRETLAVGGIAVGTDAHRECGGGLVELGVGKEDDLEAVIERETAIFRFVIGGLGPGRNVSGNFSADQGGKHEDRQEDEGRESFEHKERV